MFGWKDIQNCFTGLLFAQGAKLRPPSCDAIESVVAPKKTLFGSRCWLGVAVPSDPGDWENVNVLFFSKSSEHARSVVFFLLVQNLTILTFHIYGEIEIFV